VVIIWAKAPQLLDCSNPHSPSLNYKSGRSGRSASLLGSSLFDCHPKHQTVAL
jgi:hypothetical protein